MNPYASKNQSEPVDPITGLTRAQSKARGSKYNGVINHKTMEKANGNVPKVKTLPKPSGLGGEKGLLEKAMEAQKYNQENKYRLGGLNISNRTGNVIGSIFGRLLN